MRELELLQHIYHANVSLPQAVSIPPGDDMAMIRIGNHDVLATVDQLADGVHFDLATTPLEKIARKAITRNLSDVAAMAAKPVGALVAGALPKNFDSGRANDLFDAMRDTALSYDCPLCGGDISIWDGPLLLSVTILAEPADAPPLTRRGAQVGDVICVTGQLGGSLELLAGPKPYVHHLDFEPRLTVAQKLAADPDCRPHCMIDLSDGLAMDMAHLCRASHVGAEIRIDALPLSAGASQAAQRDQQPPWHHALADGEDYELCFTVSPQQAQTALPPDIDGVPITRVGVVTGGESQTINLKLPDGSVIPATDMGWEHRS